MTLMTHCGTKKITRTELRQAPVPASTDTYKPVPHIGLVESLMETLSFRQVNVVRDEYAISRDGMKMFGILELEYGPAAVNFAIGIRNANDKSMRLAMTAGYRVLVCDNMAFSGDFTPLLHKHTKKLDIQDLMAVGVDRIQRNFEPLRKRILDWQRQTLIDNEVKAILYDAFVLKKLRLPSQLVHRVYRNYFEPEYEDFRPRTLWSLSNAFTTAFKDLHPMREFQLAARIGSFLKQYERPEDGACVT